MTAYQTDWIIVVFYSCAPCGWPTWAETCKCDDVIKQIYEHSLDFYSLRCGKMHGDKHIKTNLQFRFTFPHTAQHTEYDLDMSCVNDLTHIYCVIYLPYGHTFDDICVTCYQLALVNTSPFCVPVKQRKDISYNKFTRNLHIASIAFIHLIRSATRSAG